MDANEQLDALLVDYLDGSLDDAGKAKVERLLSENPELVNDLNEITRTKEMLVGLDQVSPPADFAQKVLEANEAFEAQAVDYMEGALDGQAKEEFESLLSRDPELLEELKGADKVRNALKSLPEAAPPGDLLENVLAATSPKTPFIRRVMDFLFPEKKIAWGALAAGAIACTLLVVVLTIPGLNPQKGMMAEESTVVKVAKSSPKAASPTTTVSGPAPEEKAILLADSEFAKPKKAKMYADSLTGKEVKEPAPPSPMAESDKADKSKDTGGLAGAMVAGGDGTLADQPVDGFKFHSKLAEGRKLEGKRLDTDALAKEGGIHAMGLASEKTAKKSTLDTRGADSVDDDSPGPFMYEMPPTRPVRKYSMERSEAKAKKKPPVKSAPVATGNNRFRDELKPDGAPEIAADEDNYLENEIIEPEILAIVKRFEGAISGITKSGTELITSKKDFGVIWSKIYEGQPFAEPPPSIDFDRNFLLGIYLGTKPTGGYSVKITRVEFVGGKIMVYAHRKSPKPGQLSTLALTRPYSIVAVAMPEEFQVQKGTPVEFIYE